MRVMAKLGRWAAERRVVLAAGLVGALPVVLSAARQVAADWTPVGDNAVIALRAWDVLSSDPPLLGQYSAASEVLGTGTYSLGPLLYWLLALPGRLGDPIALSVTMGIVNTAAVFGVVALARRRGGDALMIAAAAAMVVMAASLPAKVYSDIWNPAAGLLPFALLIFLTWSLACGEYRLLPLTALVGSFVVQCHLTYLPATAGLVAVGMAGMFRAPADDRDSRRRWALAALAVAAVCWSAPLLEQAIHRPGNIARLVQTATAGEPTLGAEVGWRALAGTVGLTPWWLQVGDGPTERVAEVAEPVGALRAASTVLVLVALAAMTVAGLRGRRRDVAAAGAQGIVVSAAIALVASSTPSLGLLGLSVAYTLWWGSVAGMWVWLALAFGAVSLAKDRVSLPRRPALAALAVAAVAAGLVSTLRAGAGPDLLEPTYAPMRTLAERLDDELPPERTVLVEVSRTSGGFDSRFDFQMGAIYALRRQGTEPVTDEPAALGDRYDAAGHDVDEVLRIGPTSEPQPPDAREIARVEPDGGRRTPLVVTLTSAR